MSRPELNGDTRLSIKDRLAYLWRNVVRNFRTSRPGISSRSYHPQSVSKDVEPSSPSRALTLTFLNDILPQILPPRKIHMLDIGCGSGFMSDILAASGYTGAYTGIDVGNRFNTTFSHEDAFDRSFVQEDVHAFKTDDKFDLIFSFSALEHIHNDAELVDKLTSLSAENGLQLHVVPSGWGLGLYLWHGYRQYTKADIVDRFGSNNLEIYALGGLFSYALHFLFITVLEMVLRLPVRKRFGSVYTFTHRMCHKLDRLLPIFPSAYVICKRT